MRTTGGTRGADPAHRAPTTHACQVPIRSLPEEWLWCEAWCGNASLPKAKVRARVRVRVHRVRVRVRGRVRVSVRVRANPHLNPNLNQDDRPMQQPAHQGAQARPGSPAHISPYLPYLPISPISPISPHISPYLPISPQARPGAQARGGALAGARQPARGHHGQGGQRRRREHGSKRRALDAGVWRSPCRVCVISVWFSQRVCRLILGTWYGFTALRFTCVQTSSVVETFTKTQITL